MRQFFLEAPQIKMIDPLSKILGVSDDGLIVYTYEDAVKLAGHSCPTVAGAYMMILKALQKLYPNSLPVRGEITVCVRGVLGEGTVGVIANVISFVTGATDISGFHGLAGNFDRRNLLSFDPNLRADISVGRADGSQKAFVSYNPSSIAPDREMPFLFQKALSPQANDQDIARFGALWQDRVKRVLENIDNEDVIRVILQ